MELATPRWLVTTHGLEDLDDPQGRTYSWDTILESSPDVAGGIDDSADFRFAWWEARARLGQIT